MTIAFADEEITEDIPLDLPPALENVEYPCTVCGRESGPYGGRGRKPKFCEEHKKSGVKSTRKVTGQPAQLAAQATAVLVQLNGLLAVTAMGFQMFDTAGAIAKANSSFEEQAHAALLTDPELCKLILKSGTMSSKLSLGLAYVGLGMAVLPPAVLELKAKRELREQRKAEQEANV